MALWSKKDAELAERLLKPEYLNQTFLGYMNDYLAVNMPPFPASNIIGAANYVEKLDSSMVPYGINNSTTEEEFYGIDIPANYLTPEGALLTIINATMEQSAAATPTFTFEVSYGGQAIYRQTSATISQIANEFSVMIISMLNNYQQSDYVFLAGIFAASRRTGIDSVGMGNFWGAGNIGTFGGFATVDTTLKHRLSFTGQWSAASNDHRFDKYGAVTLRVGYRGSDG